MAHASMGTVHIFVVTLTLPLSLSLLHSLSSLSSFLQSLSPPLPIPAAAVDVRVDLRNYPLQQSFACDHQYCCPPPGMQGHEGRYQVDVVGGQAITMSSSGGGVPPLSVPWPSSALPAVVAIAIPGVIVVLVVAIFVVTAHVVIE